MWIFTQALAAAWYSLAGEPAPRSIMKIFGILILAVGLILGGYALTMSVSIDVSAQDIGDGIKLPAIQVANLDRMAQRQNLMIFSGILAVVGAILTGFASMRQVATAPINGALEGESEAVWRVEGALDQTSVSICPKCRHMDSGDAIECGRCGAAIAT
jgi:hypothetical protein